MWQTKVLESNLICAGGRVGGYLVWWPLRFSRLRWSKGYSHLNILKLTSKSEVKGNVSVGDPFLTILTPEGHPTSQPYLGPRCTGVQWLKGMKTIIHHGSWQIGIKSLCNCNFSPNPCICNSNFHQKKNRRRRHSWTITGENSMRCFWIFFLYFQQLLAVNLAKQSKLKVIFLNWKNLTYSMILKRS